MRLLLSRKDLAGSRLRRSGTIFVAQEKRETLGGAPDLVVHMWPWKKRTRRESETTRVLSLLTPEEANALGGLPAEAQAGVFDSDELNVSGFRPNPEFVAFLHEVLASYGPLDAELQNAAQAQREGWVYVIDLRTPEGPQGRVPAEDILGAFEVQDGEVVEGSYQPMQTHQIYTEDGLVVLPESLRRAFVDELHRRYG